MKKQLWLFPGAAVMSMTAASTRALAATPFYMGSDTSLLPFIEGRGGTYRDSKTVRPAEQILVNHGDNLFRLRLFVNPDTNYDNAANHGAIQTEAYDIALAQRLKATGAKILLDLHYSDTWADPSHQAKPAAWASQDWSTLQTTVRNYTRDTLQHFRDAGVMPDMVQVGNEITNGMLYGTSVVPPNGGQVVYTGANQTQSWQNFGILLNSAIAGVRDVDAQTPGQHTDIAIHADGGNVTGRAQYYFNQITSPSFANVPASSFDIMGMSFYGTTTADVGTLNTNLTYLANNFTTKVMVLETNHLWKGTSSGSWPSTPQGQSDFLVAVRDTVKNLPNGRGSGVVYWYPESIQIPGTFMWQNGGVALFDDDTDGAGADGHDALTAINAFSTTSPTWNIDASGNWYNAMNWTGGVPMFAGNAATFGSAITAPRTVTMDSARSVGSITFNNATSAYTIAGPGTLTLDAAGGAAPSMTVSGGNHVVTAPVALLGNTTVTVSPAGASLTLSNLNPAPGTTLTKSGAGKLEANRLRADTLTINAGAVALLADQSSAGTSWLANLNIASGASLDLAENKLVITTTPIGSFSGSAYTGVTGMIASAQLTSSEQSGTYKMLAIARGSDVRPNSATTTDTWSGQTIIGSDTLVMYTYGGDANLDGQINIDDYIKIDTGLANGLTGWSNGDFNYDGKVNIDDYTTVIDANIGNQTGIFPTAGGAVTAIPEPATFSLLALAAILLPTRRRRHADC